METQVDGTESNLEPGQVVELTADECWSAAARQPVGRLAWVGAHGPTVVPVNFVLTGSQVHLRTAAYSALARECDDSVVAFEIDDFEGNERSGWSVLMRGRAHLLFGSDIQSQPDVWPAGPHGLQVRIDVDEISGRRIA